MLVKSQNGGILYVTMLHEGMRVTNPQAKMFKLQCEK